MLPSIVGPYETTSSISINLKVTQKQQIQIASRRRLHVHRQRKSRFTNAFVPSQTLEVIITREAELMLGMIFCVTL